MGRGRSKSKLTRSERIERAFELYAKGYSNADVARDLDVHPDTAAAYRKRYNDQIREAVEADPNMLTDTHKNTMLMLRRIEEVSRDAWKQMDGRREVSWMCQCGCNQETTIELPLSDTARAAYYSAVLKAADMMAKLYNLMGVKQDVFVQFQQTNLVQRKMLEWMADNLCAIDREALADFIDRDLSQLMPALGRGVTEFDDDIEDAELVESASG